MSAETNWAQRQEWAQERNEVEIKNRTRLIPDSLMRCEMSSCFKTAKWTTEVGFVRSRLAETFYLCDQHKKNDDFVFEEFQRNLGE